MNTKSQPANPVLNVTIRPCPYWGREVPAWFTNCATCENARACYREYERSHDHHAVQGDKHSTEAVQA